MSDLAVRYLPAIAHDHNHEAPSRRVLRGDLDALQKFAALELITLSTDANRARMIAMNKSGKDYVDAADITSLA